MLIPTALNSRCHFDLSIGITQNEVDLASSTPSPNTWVRRTATISRRLLSCY